MHRADDVFVYVDAWKQSSLAVSEPDPAKVVATPMSIRTHLLSVPRKAASTAEIFYHFYWCSCTYKGFPSALNEIAPLGYASVGF